MELTQARAALKNGYAFIATLPKLEDLRQLSPDALQSVEDSLELSMLSISNSYNALLPVNSLPPEILRLIFQYVLPPLLSEVRQFLWPSSVLKYPFDALLSISSVCHRWRQICLDDQSLWSHILDCNYHYTASEFQTYVKRSGTAPLKMFINTLQVDPEIATLLLTDGSRIEEMCIFYPYIEHCTDFPAPALEQLTVYSNPTLPVPRNPVLFCNHTPRLFSLALNSGAWLPKNQFNNLTQLFLRAEDMPSIGMHIPNTSWTLTDLLIFLTNCPRLEDIVLIEFYPALQATDADLPVIACQCLKRISIGEMSTEVISWLLEHITMPAEVAIRLFGVDSEYIVREDVLSALPKAQDVRTLRVWMDMPKYKNAVIGVAAASVSSAVRIEAVVEDYAMTEDLAWTLDTWTLLASRMPLGRITELHVVDGGWVQRFADFGALFGMLPQLSTLVYANGDNDLLPRLLAYLLLPNDALFSSIPPLCTKLSTLHVCMGEIEVMFESIVHFAFRRYRCGFPLRRCIIEYDASAVELCDVPILEQFVSQVDLWPSNGSPPEVDWPKICSGVEHRYWPRWS